MMRPLLAAQVGWLATTCVSAPWCSGITIPTLRTAAIYHVFHQARSSQDSSGVSVVGKTFENLFPVVMQWKNEFVCVP